MAYPSVNFQPTSSFMGLQPINVASSTQAQVLGTVIRARDVTYGEGEFIYLAGVASTAAGDAVCYNSKTGVTVRALDGGSTSIGAFAIAMAATTAGLYGWYQISGSGPINAATAAANTVAYLTSTAGQIDDTGTTAISGLTLTAATSAGFATVQVDRPAVSAVSGGGTITFASLGSTPNAAGGSASGTTITLQPADSTHPGLLSIAAQDVAGVKTFGSSIQSASGYGNSGLGSTQGLSFSGGGTVLRGTPVYVQATAGGSNYGQFDASGLTLANTVEVTTVGKGFILKSPDGTRYQIVVANGGVLSTTAA